MNSNQLLVLVDEEDRMLGSMEKMQAHHEGRLHRAFSVFIFNTKGEWLLQQRSAQKYHSANLWSNACCSHPGPNDEILLAAQKRLYEEMGLRCALHPLFSFTYKVQLCETLTEHEFDHVFIGISDELPAANTDEVAQWRYISYADLCAEYNANTEKFTYWFGLIFQQVNQAMKNITPTP
ncbi:MAG: isopentenyl-diphosphate Delta-isomerase [Bacteroidia bacterium]|jgi:isopentenyl-diphosphate delta-isomerase|nr:isopentenyl-diphosphate Delta-isomerase [Bacteroidia bacterium]MCC6769294.1 isopentenyl-diphosphate Delta-isomerase [Bacteroidia bacterium]